MSDNPVLHCLDKGVCDYRDTLEQMRLYTSERTPESPDQLWLLQHDAVYTMGMNAKPEHLLNTHQIPVVETDRGGQVTYHGPGQLVAYLLLDVRRAGLGVRELVSILENSVIDLLAAHGIEAIARQDAPGVYVNGEKVAALGLRVRKQGCYHGLSLNVDMDLSPFQGINPCGYAGMPVTSLKDLDIQMDLKEAGARLSEHLARNLGYTIALSNNSPD